MTLAKECLLYAFYHFGGWLVSALCVLIFALSQQMFFLAPVALCVALQLLVDQRRRHNNRQLNELSLNHCYRLFTQYDSTQRAQLQQLLFCSSGYLCKRHGAVLSTDITHSEQLMSLLNYSGEQRKQCINFFNSGKHPKFAIWPLLRQKHSKEAIYFFVFALKRFYQKQTKNTPLQRTWCRKLALKRMALMLGISEIEYTQPTSASSQHQKLTPKLLKAYKKLELNPGASQREISLQYRRLLNRYHPDKNSDDKHLAQRKMLSIKQAYALLSHQDD